MQKVKNKVLNGSKNQLKSLPNKESHSFKKKPVEGDDSKLKLGNRNEGSKRTRNLTIDFMKSAVFSKDFPPETRPEIAITGRSNAGKSSLINTLGTRLVAKVSSTPGKTRLLNFFNVNNQYTLVDMPGYGFASRSGGEMHSWKDMIEGYLKNRTVLMGLILVMDIRREWTQDEDNLLLFAKKINIDVVIVLTKSDKISKSDIKLKVGKLKLKCNCANIFALSSLKRTGQVELEEFIFANWIKNG